MAVRVASFFPFQTTYYLNGHSFIEDELKRAGTGFRKHTPSLPLPIRLRCRRRPTGGARTLSAGGSTTGR